MRDFAAAIHVRIKNALNPFLKKILFFPLKRPRSPLSIFERPLGEGGSDVYAGRSSHSVPGDKAAADSWRCLVLSQKSHWLGHLVAVLAARAGKKG